MAYESTSLHVLDKKVQFSSGFVTRDNANYGPALSLELADSLFKVWALTIFLQPENVLPLCETLEKAVAQMRRSVVTCPSPPCPGLMAEWKTAYDE